MHIFFVDPKHCEPPHRVTDQNKLTVLLRSLKGMGWSGPPLVGYFRIGDRAHKTIVLLSGSHRWAAATELGYKIPVEVYSQEQAESRHGKPEWITMMNPPATVRHQYSKDGITELV